MQIQTFVFFGQVGSGKGTQVDLLVKALKEKDSHECVFTSTGSEYRKMIESGTYTGNLIKDSMARGELQPDFLTNAIFTNVLAANLTADKHLLADGYPRTVVQSETFDALMKFYKRDNIKIIYIELSQEEATKRNMLRGRHDDTEEGLKRRFAEYENNVIPAMNYFKDKDNYTIYTIQGERGIEQVHKDIIKAIGL